MKFIKLLLWLLVVVALFAQATLSTSTSTSSETVDTIHQDDTMQQQVGPNNTQLPKEELVHQKDEAYDGGFIEIEPSDHALSNNTYDPEFEQSEEDSMLVG